MKTVQPANVLEDLRQAPPALRRGLSLFSPPLAAYYALFGFLALLGFGRGSLTDLRQLGVFVLVGLGLNGLSSLAPKNAVWIGVLVGLALSLAATAAVLAYAGPSDLPDAAYFATMPLAFCSLNAAFFSALRKALEAGR